MFSSAAVANLLGLVGFLTVIVLSIVLYYKIGRIVELEGSVGKLKSSLDEMDEQAKLIVRTDMELNKTQEELDKKINGLYALQRLSRNITATLEENQIFKMLCDNDLVALGFENACGFLWDEKEKTFLLQVNIGFSNRVLETVKLELSAHSNKYLDLIKTQAILSSISKDDFGLRDKIKEIFSVRDFVFSPILPKEGKKGLLFVGTNNEDTVINEGDEELIAILANQLGEALENARLFERIWGAQQELEKKVDERTRALSLALEEVKKMNQRKTDFISAVSHELRTPLTSIKGYASILLTGKLGEVPEEVRVRIERINRHSDELTHLVNDLLDIARIESGKMLMKNERLDLKAIIQNVEELLSIQLKQNNIDFAVNLNDNISTITADRGQIERVFINIIGNALKFTPPQGKITITAHKIDAFVQIDISDTGCGIPEESQEAVFEEFYRVDNTINLGVKGTGAWA